MADQLQRLPISLTRFIGLKQQVQMLAVEAKKAGRQKLSGHCFSVADEMDEWLRRVIPNG